jgi:hypothetical protein
MPSALERRIALIPTFPELDTERPGYVLTRTS